MPIHWANLSHRLTMQGYHSRIYKAFFGVDVESTNEIWEFIAGRDPSIQPIHLLWTLYFLKKNPSDLVTHFNAAVNTWKRKVKLVLQLLDDHLPDV